MSNIKLFTGSIFFLFSLMFLFFSLFVFNPNCASADSTLPSDYCFVQGLTLTNNKNTDMSYQSIRVTKDTQTLINNGIIDNNTNTYSLTNPSLNNIEFLFSNFNDIASPMWIVPTNLNSTNSVIYNLYYGTNSNFRDPGLYFEGSSNAIIGDSNDLDLNDNFTIHVDINNLKYDKTCSSADSGVISNLVYKNDYKLYFYCLSGAINVIGTVGDLSIGGVNSASVTSQLGTSYENQNITIKLEKTSTQLKLYIADVLVDVTTANFTVASNTNPLEIGNNNLKATVIRNVIFENNVSNLQIATWTFNNLLETSSTNNTYTYTFNDSVGSNNGIFTKIYDPSGIIFTFSNPNSEIIQFIDQIADVSGEALTGVTTQTSTNKFNPIIPVVEPVAQGIKLPLTITYTVLFSVIGLILATGLNSFAPNPIFSLVGFLIPISLATVSGLLPPAIFWIYLLIGFAGWGVLNWSRNR